MSESRARNGQSLRILEGGLDFEIRTTGQDIRVSLSGTLDRGMLDRIRNALVSRLNARGFRVILDGSGLEHVDYRAARDLLSWNGALKSFGHELSLSGWSAYHKTILLLGYHNVDNTQRPLGGRVSIV